MFEAAFPHSRNETGLLQDIEVLGDRLASRNEPVLHREPGTDFEQRLTVPVHELIEDCSPRPVIQCFVNISADA